MKYFKLVGNKIDIILHVHISIQFELVNHQNIIQNHLLQNFVHFRISRLTHFKAEAENKC